MEGTDRGDFCLLLRMMGLLGTFTIFNGAKTIKNLVNKCFCPRFIDKSLTISCKQSLFFCFVF